VGPKIVTDESKKAMRQALDRIQSGAFAEEWLNEYRTGGKTFQKLREADAAHPVEQVGARLREMMPFLEG
jgi:ketol-acid reductoisomerase